jgi:dipeptidyl aminopeptidase/acylaminoacyl peptidase
VAWFFILAIHWGVSRADGTRNHVANIDDYMRMQYFGSFAISPDGRSVAYALSRPMDKNETLPNPRVMFEPHSYDVWLAMLDNGSPKRLTNGESDDSSFFDPQWSLDGSYIAMRSTRGGELGWWVWSRSSGKLRQLTRATVSNDSELRPKWITSHELVVYQEPTGVLWQIPNAVRCLESPGSDCRGTTANVLESGLDVPMENRPQGALLLCDAQTGRTKVLATAPTISAYEVSPDGHKVAFLSQGAVWQPGPDLPVQRPVWSEYELRIADLRKSVPVRTVVDPHRIPPYSSLTWAADSTELTLSSNFPNGPTPHVDLFRCAISTYLCRRIGRDDSIFVSASVLWYGQHKLAISVRIREPKVSNSGPLNKVFGVVDESGKFQRFSEEGSTERGKLFALGTASTLLQMDTDHLWEIDSTGRKVKDLTPDLPEVEVVDPTDTGVLGPLILLRVDGDGNTRYLEFNTQSGRYRVIQKPAPNAQVSAYNARAGTSVFLTIDNTGSYAWVKGAAEAPAMKLVEANLFLRELLPFKKRSFSYKASTGEALWGEVLVPADFTSNTRYPTVVFVYPGSVYFGQNDAFEDDYVTGSDSLRVLYVQMELLAAQGYAVLYPCMPLLPPGESDDPYQKLQDGVMPAVDRVVALGIADPDRLGIMGASYGGFATFGLITQTNRFKAAVAMNGLSDLIREYLAFKTPYKFGLFPQENNSFYYYESGQQRMGKPFWQDIDRYLRNSPITFVDRVTTPVLILHGADDPTVSVEQSEEFFNALYRQNKRAQLVRYWGEGHANESAANIRDSWKRIFSWFDEFLKNPEGRPNPAR